MIRKVVEFCNASTHNQEAPNLQNQMCSLRSAWDVIADSDDFNHSLPLQGAELPPPPVFSLIQAGDRTVCLVLDVSSKMAEADRLLQLQQAAEFYLMQIVEIHTFVGIASFNSKGEIRAQLHQVNNDEDRKLLISYLPATASADAETSVCAGLKKGFEVVEKLNGKAFGSVMILVTSGDDERTADCLPTVLSSGSTIHTIALGSSAVKNLEEVSRLTALGVISHNFKVYSGAYSFPAAQNGAGGGAWGGGKAQRKLESTGENVKAQHQLKSTVTVDSSVGNDTTFLVTWQTSGPPEIVLYDPSGRKYHTDDFITNLAFRTARLWIPGTAKPGLWTYTLNNTHHSLQALKVTVTSRTSCSAVPPAAVEAFVEGDSTRFPHPMMIYAIVRKGFYPILNATVTATIEPETADPVTLELFDDGAGNIQMNAPSKSVGRSEKEQKWGFSRVSSGGAFSVLGVPAGPQPDVFPPCKIIDLEAVKVEEEVTLSWTAPGDDFDQGQGALSESLIQLNNNGYEGIVIAIDPNVPEDETLIQQIKDMVTQASPYLFEATEKRFYFKSVAILIPENWKTKPEYVKPKLETYKNADILVAEPNSPGNDGPYTEQWGNCGEKGERIYFTPDFVAGKKLPQYGPQAEPPKPTFSLLQIGQRVVCLVLDKSGSMVVRSADDRLNRLNQAGKLFLLQTVEQGSWVGMVTFDRAAYVKSQLIQINSGTERDMLTRSLPMVASGGTSICSGLRSAFTVIKKKYPTDGSEIVLLTDGEDNTISTCLNDVKRSGAIIHTVALGPSAAKELEELSKMTGGLQTYASDQAQNNGLIDAFGALSSGNKAVSQRSIQLESKGLTLQNSQWMNGTVIVDSTVGKDTLFLITWTTAPPQILLWDPSGKKQDGFVVDKQTKMAYLQIPGIAKVGTWKYSLQASSQTLTLTVTSRASSATLPPVTVTSKMNKDTGKFPHPMVVYAKIRQGDLPVLRAKVTALIESVNGKTVTLELLDNGAGADATKNDGIYSRYFTTYDTNGRYSVKVWALGGVNTASQRVTPQQSGVMYIPGWIENGEVKWNPPRPEINEDDLQGNQVYFSRTASGGSFVASEVPQAPIPDLFPPCKITDLKAKIQGDNLINLTWTAPGDDYDHGRADKYIIGISTDILDLRDKFNDSLQVNTTDLIPKEANSEEVFVFKPENIPFTNGTDLFIAIQAVDKVNLKSEISNIAQVSLFIPPETPSETPPETPCPAITVNSTIPGIHVFKIVWKWLGELHIYQ
ncbi:chloride channel accessory 1 [Camelus ferus]|nr:chloride channel accessory 1 [Camelus ferus]